MSTYIKTIDNQAIIKNLKDIVIYKNGKQIIKPTAEMVKEDGWEEYTPQNSFLHEETLDDIIDDVVQNIKVYDDSDDVNVCYIVCDGNVIPYWANKLERTSLESAVRYSMDKGRTTYRLDLRDIGVSVNINCEQLLDMLSRLEIYAIDCYNKTTDHIFAVKSLTTIEDVKSYDYKCGYPEKIRFEL